MNTRFFRLIVSSLVVFALGFGFSPSLFAQRPSAQRPAIKLTGFFNATPPKSNVRPILTLAFPGNEERYTFIVTDLKILAGPLQTPGAILDEVTPFTPSFYVRMSPTDAHHLTSATPAEQVTILGEYVKGKRNLLVTGFQKMEQPRMH